MAKYKVAGEREVLGLAPGSVLEADEVLGIKGYDLNSLVEAGHLVVVDDNTPVGTPPKKDVKKAAPAAKPADKSNDK